MIRINPKWCHSTLFAISVWLMFASNTRAETPVYLSQRIDPLNYNCSDFLDERIKSNGLLDAPDQALEFEHCFRLQQLALIANQRIDGAEPEFYVESVPRFKLPKGATSDVPILRVVFPQRVFFDTGKSFLRPEADEVVDIIVSSLRKDAPDVTVFVAGHTDPRGGSDYNYNLSIDRAYTVAKRIFEKGGMSRNLWWIGFGEDMPLVPNTGPTAWGYNRRVEFLFSGTPAAIAIWMADMQIDGLCASNSESDAKQCKRELALKSTYEAIELREEESTPSKPANVARRIEPNASKDGTNPSRPPDVAINARSQAIRVLNPVPGRRFTIDPTRRTATPSR
jgi:outer membrane protein OmpA-like peptidoglycan-associated protein